MTIKEEKKLRRKQKKKQRNNSIEKNLNKERCVFCGGKQEWCGICNTWTRVCCVRYGTCKCS